jgi:uncharacterized protein YjbJ (UPF0337 family)
MNWDQVEGQWKQRRGKASDLWGKMMNDELAAVAGKYVELVGKLQEKYGIAKQEAKQQANCFKLQCIACRRRNSEQLKEFNIKLMKMRTALNKQKKAIRKPVNSKTPAGKRLRSATSG